MACSDGKNNRPTTGATNSKTNRSNKSSAQPRHEAITAPITCRWSTAGKAAPFCAATDIVISLIISGPSFDRPVLRHVLDCVLLVVLINFYRPTTVDDVVFDAALVYLRASIVSAIFSAIMMVG